jgi:hypothetical protein
MLDTTAEEPVWELRKTFDRRRENNRWCENYFVSFLDQALVQVVRADETRDYDSLLISYDQGSTWTDFAESLDVGGIASTGGASEFYKLGLYKRTGSPLDWYDVDTRTWTTYTVNFENVVGVSPNRDGVYFKRGHEIHKWSLDGTETLITTLPSDDFEASVVGNDLYVSKMFNLWRMQL